MASENKSLGGEERDLGMDALITRRDFLNGVVVGVGALGAMSPETLLRAGVFQEDYPPAKTGLRGSHEGAFEVAHRMRDGAKPESFGRPSRADSRYDLIVIGAGISGLAAAYYYRKQAGPNAKILIIDNHDDFGGHARRNEFVVGGKTLIGYGGTQSIDTPGRYSAVAKALLKDLSINTDAFEHYYDQQYFKKLGLSHGTFFNRETFGQDALVAQPDSLSWGGFFAKAPLSPAVRKALTTLHTSKRDYLKGKSKAAKLELLSKTSYADYLMKYCGVPPDALPFLQKSTHDYFGVGIDAVPAGDCRTLEHPGFEGLGLLPTDVGPGQGLTSRLLRDEEYIHHFPDGGASIAKLLVRQLIPGAVGGATMVDVVTERTHYAALDKPKNATRLRLGATAVHVQHTSPAAPSDVAVTYVKGGKAYEVSGAACVMACWHGIVPHICPSLGAKRAEALKYGVKVPLLYANVALRQWTSLAKLKVRAVEAPGSYWSGTSVDFPVSMGGYAFSAGPHEPVLLHMVRTPCSPGKPARDQQRLGRAELLGATFADFEREIRSQLTRMLSAGGFDAARDIAGITVNRWPHGYAYEYNSLYDPVWPRGQAPNEIARERFGSIVFANSDAAAYAYTDAAIDEAYRAVSELRGLR